MSIKLPNSKSSQEMQRNMMEVKVYYIIISKGILFRCPNHYGRLSKGNGNRKNGEQTIGNKNI